MITLFPRPSAPHFLNLPQRSGRSEGYRRGLRSLSWLSVACLALAMNAPTGSAQAPADAAVPSVAPAPAASQEVALPLHLDYPLLEKLLVAQVFTGENQSLDLLGTTNSCNDIALREPALAGEEGLLHLRARIRADVGIGAQGACTRLFSFEGSLAVRGKPELRDDGAALAFAPQEIWLLDAAGERVYNDALEALATSGVRSVFASYQFDLAPQLQSVSAFLPDFLPRHSRKQIDALIGTIRIAEIAADPDGVDAQISLRIEPVAPAAPPEATLTEAELALWEERWQAMDALLVFAVKRYAGATSLQELRVALLDALIESRYRLRDALAEPVGGDRDAVREWFLQSWEGLAPVIRRIGMEQSGQEQLLLLDVVTAADALEALDQLGPGIGLEISVDGVRRLARMINAGEGVDILTYSPEVDPALRRLLEESLGAPAPAASWNLDFRLFPRAVAADAARLNSWAPQRDDLPEYLPLVGALLHRSADEAVRKRGLEATYATLFHNLVLTTAWQESCWRHYVVSDDRKLVPMRSGTGDVGLMQVNERVWRGFYDQQRLRWDIDYNSEAGAEVLIDYLMKYALRKGEHRQPGGLSNLARASYSAYNGGPSRVSRYRSAKASAYARKVDAAFWEKYQQVAAGNELAVSTCFGGNLSGRAAPGARPGGTDDGKRFALQLGAFSSEGAARSFIAQQGFDSRARVFPRGTGNAAQFLVLYGDFATRADADAARSGLGVEAWPRRLGDL